MPKEISRLDTRQNYDRLSRWYDSFSASERSIAEAGLRMLNVQPGEKVLEIGFGTGHALVELAGSSGEAGLVFGINLSPGMIVIANRRIQHSAIREKIILQVGDATHPPYLDDGFQVVFMSFTVELFDLFEIPVVLAECQRILQPGGRLGIVSLAKRDACVVGIYEWFHIHFPKVVDCRPINIHPLLEEAEFGLIQTTEKRLWGLPVDVVVAQKA